MGIVDRVRAALTRTKSDGGTGLVNWTREGGVPVSWPSNWFQLGHKPIGVQGGSVVEACIAAYARTLAQLPGKHYRIDEATGARTLIPNSNLSVVLHRPNEYQTISDFLLNLVYQLYRNGNAYFVMSEDQQSIHLLNSPDTTVQRVAQSGDIFYDTGGLFAEQIGLDSRVLIPSRYVAHIRLHTPIDPLIGVTPIEAASMSVAANAALSGHQASFFNNMSRPSGVLTTDMELTRDQMVQLREAWEMQAKALNSGGVPILSNGLKWDSMSQSNREAEMIEALNYTVEDISRVFGVPLMLINSMENATFDNAETLMRFWLASGLGFLVNHVEKAFAQLYRLSANQTVEFDTEVLLRSDLQARMEAMGVGVTKGIYSPNEARRREGLAPVEGGEIPFVQQQMVPVDVAATGAQLNAGPSPAPEPTPEPEDETLDERGLLMLSRSYLEEMHDAA